MATPSTAVATRSASAPAPVLEPDVPEAEPQASAFGPIPVGAAVTAGAQVVFFGALFATYLLLRHVTSPWPADGVTLDQYRGTMVFGTALMATTTAAWALHAIRLDDQRHTMIGLGLSAGLALATANLTWFTVTRLGVSAGSSPYATVLYVLLGAYAVATAVAGVAFLLVWIMK